MSYFIQTYTKQKFPFDLSKEIPLESFNLIDIAVALSRIVRFNGHTIRPYTVAAHILNFLPACTTPAERAAWIFHEIAEAYIGDIVHPLKCQLPELAAFEKQIEEAGRHWLTQTHFQHWQGTIKKWILQEDWIASIKHIDVAAQICEGRYLLTGGCLDDWDLEIEKRFKHHTGKKLPVFARGVLVHHEPHWTELREVMAEALYA